MEIIFIIIGIFIGFTAGYFFAKKNIDSQFQDLEQVKKEMENTFKALAADVNKSNTEEFFKLANDKFSNLSKESDKNLDQKKKLIDQNLEEMSKKLDSIQKQSTELNVNIEQKKTETQMHFVYHKCQNCGSYNTEI